MPNQDSLLKAFDVAELATISHAMHVPADATPHTDVNLKWRGPAFVSWLYDHGYGWTPKKEQAFPRPPLQMPPYFTGSFPLRVTTLAGARHNYVVVDLRPFPERARVFAKLPTKLLPKKLIKKLLSGKPAAVGSNARVVRKVDQFNLLFPHARVSKPATKSTVVVEFARGTKATLDDLQLTNHLETIELCYGVLRDYVQPKTYYAINFMQFIDYRMMGRFSHIYQAYHRYDVPIIGDARTRLAYRRSSSEVSDIPSMSLAFFDTWFHAHQAGYDFAPRSYGRHFTPADISPDLEKRILEYFNNPKLTAKRINQDIVDNPYVDAAGLPEKKPTKKVGVTIKVAQAILAARKKLKKKKFTSLAEIDKVSGVGPDTLSDIITSVMGMRRPPRRHGRRYVPNPAVVKLLK